MRFLKNRKGVTMIEYALLAALISLVAITAITAIGTNMSTKFQNIADKLAPPK